MNATYAPLGGWFGDLVERAKHNANVQAASTAASNWIEGASAIVGRSPNPEVLAAGAAQAGREAAAETKAKVETPEFEERLAESVAEKTGMSTEDVKKNGEKKAKWPIYLAIAASLGLLGVGVWQLR